MLRKLARRAIVLASVGLGAFVGTAVVLGVLSQQAHAVTPLPDYSVLLCILLVANLRYIASVGVWIYTPWTPAQTVLTTDPPQGTDTADTGTTPTLATAQATTDSGLATLEMFVAYLDDPGPTADGNYSGSLTICLCAAGPPPDTSCTPTLPSAFFEITGTADGTTTETGDAPIGFGSACAAATGTMDHGTLVDAAGTADLALPVYLWTGDQGPQLFTATLDDWSVSGTASSPATSTYTIGGHVTLDQFGEEAWTEGFPSDIPFPGATGSITANLSLTAKAPNPFAVDVSIDIKPGSDDNAINLGSNGQVPVAILSSPDFDASTVDPASCMLEGVDVSVHGKSDNPMASLEDVNADGLPDLVTHFDTDALELSSDASTATVECLTLPDANGLVWPIRGTDSIRIVSD